MRNFTETCYAVIFIVSLCSDKSINALGIRLPGGPVTNSNFSIEGVVSLSTTISLHLSCALLSLCSVKVIDKMLSKKLLLKSIPVCQMLMLKYPVSYLVISFFSQILFCLFSRNEVCSKGYYSKTQEDAGHLMLSYYNCRCCCELFKHFVRLNILLVCLLSIQNGLTYFVTKSEYSCVSYCVDHTYPVRCSVFYTTFPSPSCCGLQLLSCDKIHNKNFVFQYLVYLHFMYHIQ